uniref:G-protein coupled receptors family 1 profile domain-containing protein n=1 Tax=Plectus sambesii TaxID=2011161 RepID=A0A914V1H3_9BILA
MDPSLVKFFKIFSLALDVFLFLTGPIYILVLLALWKNRKEEVLKHAFFKLMISIGIADVGTMLNLFFTIRLAQWGLVPELFIWLGGRSSRLSTTLVFFFANSQALMVLIVAINRYTAYMVPLRHRQLWQDGKLLLWSIVGVWIIALISIIPVVFIFEYQIYISPVDNRTIYFQWVNADDYFYYSIPSAFIGRPLIAISVFILYGNIFFTAFRKYRQGSRAKTETEKAVLNMAIIGFLHCIGLAIAIFFFIAEEIAWTVFKYNLFDVQIVSFIGTLGYTLFSAVNPYALLIFSQPTRHHFFKMYRIPTSVSFYKRKNLINVAESAHVETRIAQQVKP